MAPIHLLNPNNIDDFKKSPTSKPLRDGGGLELRWLKRSGRFVWYWDFRFQGRRSECAVGDHPDVSPAEARDIVAALRAGCLRGQHPGETLAELRGEAISRRDVGKDDLRLAARSRSFSALVDEWKESTKESWKPSTLDALNSRLRNHLLPWFGDMTGHQMTPAEIVRFGKATKNAGFGASELIPTLDKCLKHLSEILGYGEIMYEDEGWKNSLQAVRKILNLPNVSRHRPALTDPAEIGAALRLLRSTQRGTEQTRRMVMFAALVFTRPGEIRDMRWDDLDLEGRLWVCRVQKTENSGVKILDVPLSHQAVAILEEQKAFQARRGIESKFVYSGFRDSKKSVSENAMNRHLKAVGIPSSEHCPHGWRASARTLLREVLGYEVDVIEIQLAHQVSDKHGRAYNRASFLHQRTVMMQAYADLLDALAAGKDTKDRWDGKSKKVA